jgi:hypothetical protein
MLFVIVVICRHSVFCFVFFAVDFVEKDDDDGDVKLFRSFVSISGRNSHFVPGLTQYRRAHGISAAQ